MSDSHRGADAAFPLRHVPPPVDPEEDRDLTSFRDGPGDERKFGELRRRFRDAEHWRAMATLLSLHASALQNAERAADFGVQASELWLDRVQDAEQAVQALILALERRPDHPRATERAMEVFETHDRSDELLQLIEWRLAFHVSDPTERADLLVRKGVLHERFLQFGEAAESYRAALELDGDAEYPNVRLVELYLRAGLWDQAREEIAVRLDALDPSRAPEAVAELHRTMARLCDGDLGATARHLQAALQAQPDHVATLSRFGLLYLESGKGGAEGAGRAADVFFRAAELAREKGDFRLALRLLRRTLAAQADHEGAGQALEQALIDAEDWHGLDELYTEWRRYYAGRDGVPLLMRHAELLELRLGNRARARNLYEEVIEYELPWGPGWENLERIYAESHDTFALMRLLEAAESRDPASASSDDLLRIAAIHREVFHDAEQASVYDYKVLEREPFNAVAFQGYKDHWRTKQNWTQLRDLILYQIEQAEAAGDEGPLTDPEFAAEFVDLAEVCEKRLGDLEGAMDAWQRLGEAYPDDARAGANVARLQKRLKMMESMLHAQTRQLEKATEPDKRVDLLRRVAQVHRDRDADPGNAIGLYHEILEHDPSDVASYRSLITLYDRAGDYEQVVEMLRTQLERSESRTEKIALLRRLADIWQNELDAREEARWACNELRELDPEDPEPVRRLLRLSEEQGDDEGVLTWLQELVSRETELETQLGLLRRMARFARDRFDDPARQAELWRRLQELEPDNLEFTDRMEEVYEGAARWDELCTLLRRAGWAEHAAPLRRLQYRLRLGRLSIGELEDPELAREAFEGVLEVRPDHLEALENLAELHQQAERYPELAQVLRALLALADTDEDEHRIALELIEVLADRCDDADGALEVLGRIYAKHGPAHPELSQRMTELVARAKMGPETLEQLGLRLWVGERPDERRQLRERIAEGWITVYGNLGLAEANLIALAEEFNDPTAWERLAEFRAQHSEASDAIEALDAAAERTADPGERKRVLTRAADLWLEQKQDATQAMARLRLAAESAPDDAELDGRLRDVASMHDKWDALFAHYRNRIDNLGRDGGPDAERIRIALDVATLSSERKQDPSAAFDWARRAYDIARAGELADEAERARAVMEGLAKEHRMWPAYLEALSAGDAKATVEQLLEAADVAERELKDPRRALLYLRQAFFGRRDDTELQTRVLAAAEAQEDLATMVAVLEARVMGAGDDDSRLVATRELATLRLDRLDDPVGALAAWHDLLPRCESEGAAATAASEFRTVAEQHELWRFAAEHHRVRASALMDSDIAGAFTELRRAAEDLIRDEDPTAALRVLAEGVHRDPSGALWREAAVAAARQLDESSNSPQPLGTLALLQLWERAFAGAEDAETRAKVLRARAELRAEGLHDPLAACSEYIRLLGCLPDDDAARDALWAAAKAAKSPTLPLVPLGAELEAATDPVRTAEIYGQLSSEFAERLAHPELALRAGLCAWSQVPRSPDPDTIATRDAPLWQLAAAAGSYSDAPSADWLRPSLRTPEPEDKARWQAAGYDPSDLTPGEALAPAPQAAPLDGGEGRTATVTITALKSSGTAGEPAADDDAEEIITGIHVLSDEGEIIEYNTGSVSVVVEDLESIEELEELEEIEELDDADLVTGSVSGPAPTGPDEEVIDDIDQFSGIYMVDEVPAPPPASKLPALPRLEGPLLPDRPEACASGWDEVAHAYREAWPSADPRQKVLADRCIATLWHAGANDRDSAFSAMEEALLLAPEDADVWSTLDSIAGDDADARASYAALVERCRDSAELPPHRIHLSLRLGAMLHETGDAEAAVAAYDYVRTLQSDHPEALQGLLVLHEKLEQWPEYSAVYEELLDAESADLDADTRITRTLRLVELLESHTDRRGDALAHLEQLVRLHPEVRSAHERIIAAHKASGAWPQAIDALRTANEAIDDREFRIESLRQLAAIYVEHLDLPNRAIEAYEELRDLTGDGEYVEALQGLYLDTERFDQALPLIEERLQTASDELRTRLLVAKARVLQEGLGDDAGAIAALETLADESPDDDEVVRGLARTYARVGSIDKAVEVLHRRFDAVDSTERRAALAEPLFALLEDKAHDPASALRVVDRMLEDASDDPTWGRRRINLARVLARHDELADGLESVGDAASLLEAAIVARDHLDDATRARRLFERVMAGADGSTSSGQQRIASALEALVALDIADGASQAAMERMDNALAQTEGTALRGRLQAEIGRMTYRTTGDVEAARVRFRAALESDPENAAAKLGLGEVLLDAEAYEEAEQLLEAALASFDEAGDTTAGAEATLLLARVFTTTDRPAEAYRRLAAALRNQPQHLPLRRAVVENRLSAKRWRDVVTSVDQARKLLDESGDVLSASENTAFARLLSAAAGAELELKRVDAAMARLRSALEFDPDCIDARELLLQRCEEQGLLVEAAGHAEALARALQDPKRRAVALLDAGLAHHAALENGVDPDEDTQERRDHVFSCIREALTALEAFEDAVADTARVEAAYRATVTADPSLAVRCLRRLVRREQLALDTRHDMLLEAALLSMQIGTEQGLEEAEAFARSAQELQPESPRALGVLCEALDRTGRTEDASAAIRGFLERPHTEASPEALTARAELVLRLARSAASGNAAESIAAYEYAAQVAPTALTAADRTQLVELYESTGRDDDAVRTNHRSLLALDPLNTSSLGALARHFARTTDLPAAYAVYEVLVLLDPEHPDGKAFLAEHQQLAPSENIELDYAAFCNEPDASSGAPLALQTLWEQGANIISGFVPKLEFQADARVSPVGDSPVAKAWGETLRRMGQTKVALIDASAAGVEDTVGTFEVRCQQPPIIVAGPEAAEIAHQNGLVFELSRALYSTRPDALMATGVVPVQAGRLLSAALAAFHPRHSRRKHFATEGDPVHALGQELARKLPMKAAKVVSQAFKAGVEHPFDSLAWRSAVLRNADRVGLVVAGDLAAAVDRMTAEPTRGEALAAAAQQDTRIRNILAFAGSADYVSARAAAGFTVVPVVRNA